MGKLLEELKRRKVFRVAALYAVVAWVLIQVTDVVLPTFGAPEWVNQTVIFLFVLGFIPTLIAAWAYEITPEGVKPDAGVQMQTSGAPAQNQWLIYATFGLVLLVAGFQIADRFLLTPAPIDSIDSSALATSQQPVNNLSVSTRVSVKLPEEQFFNGQRGDFALSADGNLFVYRGNDEAGGSLLWQRQLNSLSAQPIPNTEGASRPRISPDGSQVVFAGNGGIRVVSLEGGPARTLVPNGGDTPSWSPDGDWIYFHNSENGLSRIPSLGGQEEVIASINADNGEREFFYPTILPGNHVLYSVRGSDGVNKIQALNAETGQKTDLVFGASPIVSRTGHLFYQLTDQASLMVAPFDIETLEVIGPARQVAEGLLLVGAGNTASIGLSDSGRLIYRTGDFSGRLATPVWIDREGLESDINPDWKMLSEGGRGVSSLSPQGDRIAISIAGGNETSSEIWISQLNGLQSRITFDGQQAMVPNWTPDGESVIYSVFGVPVGGFSFWTKRADGSGTPQLLLENEEQIRKGFISSDGEWLLYRDLPAGEGIGRIRGFKLNSNEPALTLVDSDFSVGSPELSPDGRWLAYGSDESGQWEVYVQPFPEISTGRWQVSTNGGSAPAWSHSMQELFYINEDNELVTVDIDTNNSFSWGVAQTLFSVADYRKAPDSTIYDVDTDDQRFLMMRLGDVSNSELIMVDNWFAELD